MKATVPVGKKNAKSIFDNRQRLECCEYQSFHRGVGIVVNPPYKNPEGPHASVMTLSYEYPTISSDAAGYSVTAGQLNVESVRCLQRLRAHVGKIVEELTAHDQYLARQIEQIESGKLDIDQLALDHVADSQFA